MNIAGTIKDVLEPYKKLTYEIYISGCTHGCVGCHNPEMQSFDFGKKLDDWELFKIYVDINDNIEYIDCISILGGDLLCNSPLEINFIINTLTNIFGKHGRENSNKKDFWLFTGSELKDVPEFIKSRFDVIKTGKFEIDKYVEGRFPSSTNQNVWYRE